VSTPLRWEELTEGLVPRELTMAVALERVEREGDLFEPVLRDPRPLAAARRKLEALARHES
jgi:bifunctional non-homologous end joining protein LigD